MPIEIFPDNNDYIVSRTTDQTITGRKTFLAGSATSVPVVVQAAASQTANLQEWQNSAGTSLAKIDSAGTVYSGSSYLSGNVAASSLYAVANAASRVPVTVQGVASQTANLLEIKNSAGTVLARSDNAGNFFAPGFVAGTVTGVNAALTSGTTSTGQIGAVIRGFSGQTANLQEWQNSAGTVVSQISSGGAFRSAVDVPHSFGSGESLARVTIGTANAGAVGLTIKGVAGQGSNLQEWHNSAGGAMLRIGPNGSILAGVSGSNHHFGPFVAGDATATFGGHDGSWKAIVVRAQASQSQNVQEWQYSNGAVAAGMGTHQSSSNTSPLHLNFNLIGIRWLEVGPADSGGSGYRMVRVPN